MIDNRHTIIPALELMQPLKALLDPFHIAETAVDLQLCLHSANPLHCMSLRSLVRFHFAFNPSFRSLHFNGCGVKSGVRMGIQSIAFLSALFGAPFHIHHCIIANYGFWLEYVCFQNTSRGSSRPHMLNAAFPPRESNDAGFEHSHQAALIIIKMSLTLHFWLDMKGVSIEVSFSGISEMQCSILIMICISHSF